MAKLIKINAASFKALCDGEKSIADSTNIDMPAVKRHLQALTWLSLNTGRTMEKNALRDALVVADTVAYPNQALESHRLWAGHVIADWKRMGVVQTVD
jgi:hypothetical protein